MSTWTKQKLGSIFKLEYGKGLVAEKRIPGGYPVYGSSGCVGTHNEYLVEGPGIIVGRKGSVGEIYFSKNNFYPIDTSYYISKNNQKYDIRFLYYFLKSQNLKRLQGDVGVPGLNRETIHSEVVSFIDNPKTQTCIASVLSAYDDLIENNEKRIKVLEEMAQLLYTEWFVKFKFPDHEKMKMVDSGTEYGKIPQGWEVKRLGDLIDVRGGLSYKNEFLTSDNTQLPLITMGCIHSRSLFNFPGLGFYSGKFGENHILKGGDLVMATRDVTSERKILGAPAIVPRDFKVAIAATNVYIVDNKKGELNNQFLYLLFRSTAFRNRMIAHAKGTNILMIIKDSVLGFNFVYPASSIVGKFIKIITPVFNELDKLETENQNLSKTRDLLISQLVTGRRELK